MPDPAALLLATLPRAGAAHRRRLREVWRSAGWPCRDPLEAELLAAGWLAARRDGFGRETLEVTAAGLAVMAQATAGHRAARGGHEALVERVARELQREGRLVWRGLSLRAGLDAAAAQPLAPEAEPVAAPAGVDAAEAGWLVPPMPAAPRPRWVVAQPDLFSIRPSTREDGLLPLAHEIKVHRADLLSDLRRPDKGAAYRAMAGACWYVLRDGIGDAEEVPAPFGVMVARGERLEVLRPPQRAGGGSLPLATWLALARAAPEPPPEEPAQRALGAPGPDPAADAAAGLPMLRPPA
jgi:hypothetical protein